MSFSDPQSVNFNAVVTSLPRTSTGAQSSVYTKDDGSLRLSISHSFGKRNRSVCRVEHKKIAPDVFTGSQARFNTMAYIVVDRPEVGYTPAEVKQVVDALTAFLTSSSGANVTKIIGGES